MSSACFDETIKSGGWGNYVRVKERRPGGKVELLWSDRNGGSGYDREPLPFRLRNGQGELVPEAVDKAVDEARNLSLLLAQGRLPEEARPKAPRSLGEIFDVFREEEIPHRKEYRRRELRRSLVCWETYLGRGFPVADLGRREWDSFRRDRTSGRINSDGEPVAQENRRPVSPTTAGHDLKTLRQVLSWATTWRTPGGAFLLDKAPTRGLDLPTNPNPNRPVCSEARYRKLLKGADALRVGHIYDEDTDEKVRPPLRELLEVAWHTGRRAGAIVRLRWADWAPDAEEATHGVLHWRADSDKLGRDWRAPVHPRVREVLEELRRQRPGIGEAFVFAAPEAPGKHLRVDTARGWLLDAEAKAGLDHPDGFGFHALRRAWATRRKDLPAQDVAAVGGWVETTTLQNLYQRADRETMEQVVLAAD